MASFNEVIGGLSGGAGDGVWLIVMLVLVGGFVLLLVAGFSFWYYFKKKWNLKVEVKLVRSNGKLINGEWAKGFFDANRGHVLIKRPGFKTKPIAMKVFDIKRYLQGSNLLTVIQLGPKDYRPVLNDSWTKHNVLYRDDDTGKEKTVKESILNIEVDTRLNKAWEAAFESSAKTAYSLKNILSQFQTPIAIGIVIICCFVGFAIMWSRLPSICG